MIGAGWAQSAISRLANRIEAATQSLVRKIQYVIHDGFPRGILLVKAGGGKPVAVSGRE